MIDALLLAAALWPVAGFVAGVGWLLWSAYVPRKHRHMRPLRPNTTRPTGIEPGKHWRIK